MADRPIVRVTTNEILKYRVPHSNEEIYYDLWADANDFSKSCIRCDLCQKPLVLAGTPGKRSWGYLDRHRGTPACADRQRASQRASALEAERRHRAEASLALDLITGRHGLSLEFGAHRRAESILSNTASGPSTSRSTPAISISTIASQYAGQEFDVPTPEPPATRVPSPSPNSEPSSPLPGSDLANSVDMLSDGEPESPPIAPIELEGLSRGIDSGEPLDIPDSEDGAGTCQGQLIQWTPGSVWMTYNFTYHANPRVNLPWTPHSADKDGQWIRLQSRECVLRLRDGAEKDSRTCKKCCRIANHPRLHEIMERASLPDLPKSTEHSHLNPLQMARLAKRLAKQVHQLKTEKYSLKRRLQTARSKINQYDQILVFIAQNNLRSASRVLHRSLKRGDGLSTTLDKLVASANGKGKERAVWSEEDLDIANLVRLEGGPRLLYALSKSEGLASRTTLQRRRPIPEILPSVGTPTRTEIDTNLSSMLCERARPAPEYLGAGVVLMIDDVALEEVPRYDAARNCVVGLCREHLGDLDTIINSIEDVERLEELLTSRKCHCGKESTVVAIAPVTGYNFYSPSPLVLSSTCKTEDGLTSSLWIERIIDVYRIHKYGEARHGQIMAIATDGASQFRTMRFKLCHSHELDSSSPLGKLILPLKGMNRRTGPRGILGTCDVKHILKRFATRLRSEKGIQAHTSHVLPNHILDVLQQVKGISAEKARMLLNPTDKQNVPVAVNLLQTLLELRNCTTSGSPSLRAKLDAITFIAEVLGHFLLPFITPEMSLSRQIRHLSTYSHLVTALYRKHKSGFLTNQLYADSQAIVKNIIYTTARLQLLRQGIPYYILLEGTDRLEGVFSHARTQDHASNFDILQLSHKLSIGTEINAIYARRPHLHRGHRRLNLINARGIDHINPRSWKGDVDVDHVNIQEEYDAGRADALAILARKFGLDHGVDFDAIFNAPNIDHLRPLGSYVGVNYSDPEGDDEVDTTTTSDGNEPTPNSDSSAAADVSTPEDEVTESELSDVLLGDDGATAPIPDADVDPEDCETVLEPALNGPLLGNRAPMWLEVDGKRINKHTVIASRLASTSSAARKVTHRFFRVRGDTTEALLFGKKKGKNVEGVPAEQQDDDRISAGDPGVILVRSGAHISLAVAEALNFRYGTSKTSVGSIPFNDLHDSKKQVAVALQFLELEPRIDEDDQALRWIWTGRYLKLAQPPGSEPLTTKHIAIRTTSQHYYPITPQRTDSGTWSFDHDALLKAQDEAWSDLDPHDDGILSRMNSLPEVDGAVAKLPLQCQNPHSTSTPYSLHIPNPPVDLSAEKLASDDKITCKLCPDRKKLSEMRNHVGFHILKAHRDVPDPQRHKEVEVGEFPCGWCGVEGCTTEMVTRPKRAPMISSSCGYHYANMQYGKATASNKTTPSTNVPVQCTLCPQLSNGQYPTVWKYNFWNHMGTDHIDLDTGEMAQCPAELLEVVRVRRYEEALIGIGVDYTETFRGTYGILATSNPPSEATPLEEPEVQAADLQLLAPGFNFVTNSGDEGRKRSLSDLSVSSVVSERQLRVSKIVRLDS